MEMVIELEKKPNRVIIYSIGGGFKKKEPQVEEIQDIWRFLTELLWRGDK